MLTQPLAQPPRRFVEHIERYNHVFDKFAEEGIAVFAYDGRGASECVVLAWMNLLREWAKLVIGRKEVAERKAGQ